MPVLSTGHRNTSLTQGGRDGASGYQRLSPADIDEIWSRLRAGHSVKPTARALGLPTSTVRTYLVRCGGIRPDPRHRGAGRLSLEEREEISRGLAAGCRFGRSRPGWVASPSTISREVAGNGGRRRYRATVADQVGVGQATSPKACKLATNPVLAGIVAEKLQRRWSPQQIAGWLKLTYPDDPEMQVSHESIYRTLFVQSRGALRKELTAYLRTGRVIRRSQGSAAARRPRRPAGDPQHQRTTRRSRGPRGARSLGRRPGLRQRHEPGRHPGRTIHPVPDARRRCRRQPQGRRRRRRPRRRGHSTSRPSWPRSLTWDQGHEMAEHQRFTTDDRHPGLLLRPQVTLAARQQREHQRPAAPVPAPTTRLPDPDPRRPRRHRTRAQRPTSTDPRLQDTITSTSRGVALTA